MSADGGQGGLGAALTRGLLRGRYLVIACWLALTVASVTLFPTITEAREDEGVGGFVSSESGTVDTEIRSFEQFGFPLLSRTVIVQRDPEGLPLPVQTEAVRRAVDVTQGEYPEVPLVRGALPVPNTLGLFPASRESGTTVLTYLFTPPWAGFSEQYASAQRLVDVSTGPGDAVVGVTGSIPARVEQGRLVEESLPLIEWATIAGILLIVGVVFRSVVAPLLSIVVAGVALLVTTRAAPLAADAVGVDVPTELEPLYVALVLGVVTDYVIFFLSGLRGSLRRTQDGSAAHRATREVAPIVAVAGLTVAAGTGALLFARSELFRAFGPGMALAVLVGMLVSVTLTPALLGVLGRFALWPAGFDLTGRRHKVAAGRPEHPATPAEGSKLFDLLTRRRPAAAVLAACVLGLGLAALPLRDAELGLAFVPSLPDSSPVAQAATAAEQGFAPGILSPTLVLVEDEGVTREREALARFGELLRQQPGVAGVVGPGLIPPDLEEQGVLLSESGNAARYLVVFDSPALGRPPSTTSRSCVASPPKWPRAPGWARPASPSAATPRWARRSSRRPRAT